MNGSGRLGGGAGANDAADAAGAPDLAIVGMAGRFPGAPDVEALWAAVRDGEDRLVDLDPADLVAAGLPPTLVDDPTYVRRSGIVADVDRFDAAFFGIGARDAAIMDPQHRLLLECAWEALESAGHVPERFDGAIGVFAGCGANTYLLNNLLTSPGLVEQVGWFLLRHTGNDKDFLSTGISYRLDLRGPSVNVQTACSTSLVAMHLAAQSLLGFECDLALAGGATIEVPHGRGYRYHEGEILSPDGHCRAFDERSAGTVLTSGAGMVALRRLDDAVRDGDPILAVLRGSAVNNDGARKVGYLAPSVDGHADVVREALAVAGLSARDITLVEAHGTGTAVGDPIEVAALTEAFRADTDDTGFCRLVSTKPNIGHLDTAAGVASVIKVVQALQARWLPPLANHTGPSPLLDLASTPFTLSGTGAPWISDGPRRAGVSSLGVGGTNAHVVLEEAPARPAAPAGAPEQLLVLSARTTTALDTTAERLAAHLASHPDDDLADVAHTLARGRRTHGMRRVVVARDAADAVVQLRGAARGRRHDGSAVDPAPGLVFVFPGGGSQYRGMATVLDGRFGAFHDALAEVVAATARTTGLDLAPHLGPDADDAALLRPSIALPAVFAVEVALARQWLALGLTPRAMVGHSLGEYAAAHLAGVMTIDDAVRLVGHRAELLERVGHDAAMAVVPLGAGAIEPLLPDGLSIAAVNTFDECVVSGPRAALARLAAALPDGIEPAEVPLATAAHSALLDPVLDEFATTVASVTLSPPALPYVSTLTGDWVDAEMVTRPQYWVDHLRRTVRFADALTTALADGPRAVVELGPGQALSSAARRLPSPPVVAVPVLRHRDDPIADTAHVLAALGRLWTHGAEVPVDDLAGPRRRTVRLPTYPFERERFWIEAGSVTTVTEHGVAATASAPLRTPTSNGPARLADVTDWFWTPRWVPAAAPRPPAAALGPWLLVGDADDGLVAALAAALRRRGQLVHTGRADAPPPLGEHRAVVVVAATGAAAAGGAGRVAAQRAAARWLDTTAGYAGALGATGAPARLGVVTRGALGIDGPAARPADALARGPVSVAPHEYPDLHTVLVDTTGDAAGDAALATLMAADLLGSTQTVVAHRSGHRLTPDLERTPVAPADPATARRRIVDNGTYLVTGGLGGVGHGLAMHLAREHRANLAIVSSGPVPDEAARQDWLDRHGSSDATSRRIRAVRELESLGTKVVVVTADLADPDSVDAALGEAERHLGRIDGVVHAAGRLRDRLLASMTPADAEAVVGAKAGGALELVERMERRGIGLLVLVSSTSTVLAPAGQSAYVGANAVLDALAGRHGDLDVVTIDYGVWAGRGMAAAAARRARLGLGEPEPFDHPVLTERLPDRRGSVALAGTLDAGADWVVGEHRTLEGHAVLPGTAHLDLMLTAVRAATSGVGALGLRGVTLFEPLLVPDGTTVSVRVTVDAPGPQGRRHVRVESDRGTGTTWFEHSEAEVADAEAPLGMFDRGAEARCTLDGLDPLARPRRGLALGRHWSSVTRASRGDSEAVAHLRLPDGCDADVAAWPAHPALVDVATALGVSLDAATDPDSLLVPVGYDAVTLAGPMPAAVVVHARRLATSDTDTVRIDLELADEHGTLVLTVRGLALHPVVGFARDTAAGAVAPPDLHPQAGDDALSPLLALAEGLGIGAAEGADVLERVLASGERRLVASSVDLATLRSAAPDDEPEVGPPTSAETGDRPADLTGRLTVMWRELLGVPAGPTDDFFDLGGHSLIAIRLMARVQRELGVRPALSELFEASTPDRLADRIRALRPGIDAELAATATPTVAAVAGEDALRPVGTTTSDAARSDRIVPIRSAGTGRPFFVVHGAGGNVLNLWSLVRALPDGRPVYGIQAAGIDGVEAPARSIDEMADDYVTALRAVAPGPYLLGGYSGGGLVALEMTSRLQALGETVLSVVLFDSIPTALGHPRRPAQWRNVATNVVHSGPRSLMPYWRAAWARSRFTREHGAADAAAQRDQWNELGYFDSDEFGVVNLFDHFTALALAHPPRRYDVDVVLVKASEVWPIHPEDYHWTRFVTGRIDVCVTPGDHHAMFATEHTEALAALLVPRLAAADARATRSPR